MAVHFIVIDYTVI